MRRMLLGAQAVMFIAGGLLCYALAQGEMCRVLTQEEGRRFLPDRVPMESDSIQVDSKNFAALQFPDKSRFAIALLVNSGLSSEMRQKYQFVLISETRLRLERWNIQAGMSGIALEPGKTPDAPTRVMIVRDFIGTETERAILKLDPSAPEAPLSIVPKGPTSFELRIGKYSISGSQR
jgi:hypothetical protein